MWFNVMRWGWKGAGHWFIHTTQKCVRWYKPVVDWIPHSLNSEWEHSGCSSNRCSCSASFLCYYLAATMITILYYPLLTTLINCSLLSMPLTDGRRFIDCHRFIFISVISNRLNYNHFGNHRFVVMIHDE